MENIIIIKFLKLNKQYFYFKFIIVDYKWIIKFKLLRIKLVIIIIGNRRRKIKFIRWFL